ncbi:MAG: hypothetical protein EBR60_09060, partial [Burkholderiaceae bacterium]|nr:hypothetical protein [Burkholderiaceae bacterium]
GATVPEDLEGGIRFMVDLSKSSIKAGVSQPMHLIKIYGVPDGVELSAGAEVPAEGTPGTSSYKKSFWLVTEDSITTPITMTGLPENYSGTINLTAQAVASLIQSGVVQTISQASESATAQVVVSGLADKPFLDSTVSDLSLNEGGEIYLTTNGQANGAALVSVSQIESDSNEALFVRFSLDTAGSNYVVKNYASDSSGVVLTSSNGKYEVLYSELSKIKIDFKPFFATPTEITLEGISKQGVTVATADYAATTYLDFTPVADGIQSIDVKTKEGSSITSGISVLEGVAPIINLTTVTQDSKEIAEFEIVVGGSVAGQAALQFIVNADEWEWSNSADKASYLSTNWGITANPGFWKVFYVSASGTNGQYSSNPLELIIDEYFDGTISYQARAISIDPIFGKTSSLDSSPQKSGIITVTPTVDQSNIIFELLDATSRNPIFSLNLNEGSASAWFVKRGTSLDSDETVQVDLGINSSYFTIESRPSPTVLNETQYRVAHTGTSVPTNIADLWLKPIVTVSDVSVGQSTATASYPSGLQTNPYAISLEINKSASTPILSSVADLSASIADGNDSGISIALPTKSADSSDDLLTYELSGVPDWLNPTKGTVIEVSEVNGVATSTYQFEATDLAGLKWTAARSFNSANLTAEMQWRAIHTESSNFEQKSSTAVKISISKTPVAVEPEVLGPGSFLIDEAGFIELKEYSVEVPGFSDSVANSSVLVDVNLGTGTKLTYLQVPSSPSSLLTINAGISASPEASLTLAQLQTAKISAIDPNYYGYTTDSGPRGSGPLSFSLAAKQTLGSSIAQSVATKAVSISVENIPEDVSLAAVDVIPTSENVNEGAFYALPKFVLNGTASGEDAYISLGVNSEFIVREINGLQKIELPIFYEAQHATYYESFYDLNLAKLSLGKYELLIPSGATTGAHTINLYAQSFDPATGAAGKEDLETFTINVRPTADTPVLIVPSEYELSEDELQDLYFGVTAFSPDWRESVEVQLTIIGPDGQPAPNFMIYASDVNYSAILNAQGTTVGIKYELDPDQLDPTYISVTAPVDFYNADATGQFIKSANIEQRYSVQISTTSIYQDGATAILSAPVTRNTAFIVRAVNDAPSITSGTFAGALNETSTLSATGTFSFSDVDLLDRPTAQFEFIGASGVQSDGQSPFALTDGQLAVIAAGFSLPSSTSTANQGIFSWQYARSSSQLDFLGKDDELTALFRVSVDDGFGGSDAQIVTLTITGTNDNPVITSEILTGQLSELTTAATGNIVTTGDINFTDLDLTDVHTLFNNGNGIDISSESALGSLKATLLSDTTGTGVGGKVRWTYTVPASAVEYLATGEIKVEQFEITFTDNEGFSINKTIRLTLTGTNDVPTIIASDVAGQITEGAILSEQGSFLFNDVDLTDRATASKLSSSITALKANGATPLVLSDVQKLAIENAFSLSAGPSNTNNGSVAWRYAITEESLNFLAQGERVNAVFTVQVNDANGGLVNQAVTLTITGTNDAPKIVTSGGIANGSVAEKADLSLGENTQTHAIAGRFDLTELDLSDIGGAIPMVVTAPPLGANYVGVLTPAISSTLSASGQGEVSWSFRVNDAEIDFLAHGQTLKQEYRLTVTDGAGATDTQVLTITITGSNDAPIIQSTLNLNLVEPSAPETLTQILPVTFQDVDLTNTHQVSVSNVRVSGVDRSASVQFSSIEATGNVSNLSTTINAVLPQTTSITAAQITQGVSATPKIFTTSFNALNKGDALTISGLTFVASRDISALEA